MSQIVLQQLDFSVLSPAVGDYIFGIDTIDGLPKVKTSSDTMVRIILVLV